MINKKLLEKIYRMSEKELKNFTKQTLQKTYERVACQDGFVFAQGTFPVLLVSHLDTVHKERVKEIVYSDNGNVISSPQGIGGDDRNGVYSVLEIIKKFNCSVLFCEQEEIGGIGADKFAKSALASELEFNYIIEFDRANANDAVFYQCANDEFEAFITKEFYKTNYGSYSDICDVAPALGCAAVNLSCGYYKAHTTSEYVVLSEMAKSIEAACAILERTTENDKFEYVEESTPWAFHRIYTPEDDDEYWESKYYIIEYISERGDTEWWDTVAFSKAEAIGKFVMERSSIPFDNVISVMSDANVYNYI